MRSAESPESGSGRVDGAKKNKPSANSLAVSVSKAILTPLLSPQVAEVLEEHGIPTDVHAYVLDCPQAVPILQELLGPDSVHATQSVDEVVQGVRRHRITAVLSSAAMSPGLVARFSSDIPVGVVVLDPDGQESDSAALRAQGVMDVVTEHSAEVLKPVFTRALDFRGLLLLELDHRCESRRLSNQEQGLLGDPPDSLSDDLDSVQPPPLPVGPLSVYDMESASEAFEAAYIERVQQLCGSAREAAQVLGVSPATLSRRQKREAM